MADDDAADLRTLEGARGRIDAFIRADFPGTAIDWKHYVDNFHDCTAQYYADVLLRSVRVDIEIRDPDTLEPPGDEPFDELRFPHVCFRTQFRSPIALPTSHVGLFSLMTSFWPVDLRPVLSGQSVSIAGASVSCLANALNGRRVRKGIDVLTYVESHVRDIQSWPT